MNPRATRVPAARRGLAVAMALAGLTGGVALPPALAADPPAGEPGVPLLMGLGFETWQLPGQESMGMLGGQLLFGLGRGLWLGPVAYGAATGERGGFFVGGIELQQRWPITPTLTLSAGLALGGGGGAAALVGNGLMLRPSLALQHDFGPLLAGVTWSAVRFPGTDLRSEQAGVLLSWRGQFDHVPLSRVGETQVADQRGGLGFDSVALTLARHLPGSTAPGTPPFQLVGARFEQRRQTQGASWGIEAAAAAQGSAAGYMEILAHAGYDASLARGLAVGLRGAAGLGGGGNLPAGAGPLLRLDATLAVTPAAGWQIGAAWGRTRGDSAALDGERRELWLSTALEPLQPPGTPLRAGTVRRTDWGVAALHTGAVKRADGSAQSIGALGLVLDHWLGAQLYLSGQVYGALNGGAGAYGIGLVGAGWSTGVARPGWQFGAELLAGGAGGGGVSGATGALVQGQAWAGHSLGSPAQRLKLGVGALASTAGGPAVPVVSLTWLTGFGGVGP